jgi:hypothetical protein
MYNILRMNFIYSKAFMIKSQSLEMAKICPNEISCLKIEIENINLPSELVFDSIVQQKRNRTDRTPAKWDRCPKLKTTILNQLPPDIKRITAILNKITDDNYDKMIEEAKTFNYAGPEVVTVLFKKILAEPFYSDIYARFCNSLEDLHEIINEQCITEFNKTYSKNVINFICELYKFGLLNDLNSFIDTLLDDISETKLESLCELIAILGSKNDIFVDIIIHLDSIKTNFSSRYKFMIMDTIDGKIEQKRNKEKQARKKAFGELQKIKEIRQMELTDRLKQDELDDEIKLFQKKNNFHI